MKKDEKWMEGRRKWDGGKCPAESAPQPDIEAVRGSQPPPKVSWTCRSSRDRVDERRELLEF